MTHEMKLFSRDCNELMSHANAPLYDPIAVELLGAADILNQQIAACKKSGVVYTALAAQKEEIYQTLCNYLKKMAPKYFHQLCLYSELYKVDMDILYAYFSGLARVRPNVDLSDRQKTMSYLACEILPRFNKKLNIQIREPQKEY